jgi:Late embryogenesis abundant protein
MRTRDLLVAAVALCASGCSKPSPPTFAPVSVTATSLTPLGIDLSVVLNATNPNTIPLMAQSVSGHVVLESSVDLGTVTSTQPISLPSMKTISVTVPLSVKWSSMAALLKVAASPGDVPYAVDGTVTMGDALVNVSLPFHLDGVVTHEQIVSAAAHAVPGLPRMP